MPEKLTISASYVTTMINLAQDRGLDREALLKDAGIDPKWLEIEQAVPAINYGQLHHRITRECRDEWFGMLSGEPVPMGAIRFLCESVVHCKNLEDSINRCGQFFELCRGFKVKPVLVTEGSLVTFTIERLSHISEEEFSRLLAETSEATLKSTLMVWHGFASWLIGQEIPITQVLYPFSNSHVKSDLHEPAYPIYYDQNLCGFSCDSQFLKAPIMQTENNIDEFLCRAPYYVFIQSNKTHETLSQRVKAVFAKLVGEELPNAVGVAEQLNVSVTTLHRKLSLEKTSFQKIKDEVRMEAAIYFLNSPNVPAAAIADMVGFENPSTFFRFFKKWTGLPPGEYRRKVLQQS